MRVLFLSGLYPPHTKGGGEVSTHLIARALIERGHDVRVITEGNSREESVYQGVPVLRVPVPLTAKPLFERRMSRRMAKGLRREIQRMVRGEAKPGPGEPGEAPRRTIRQPVESSGAWVVHAHDFRSALALSELGYPNMVVTARDYAQICGTTNAITVDGTICTCSWHDILRTQRVREASLPRRLARIWQYKYNIAYRRRAFAKLPAQIFISHAQEKLIRTQQNLQGVRTAVIFNPVPQDYLSTPVKTPPNHHTVLYVGTVEWYKGVGLLLEAWQRIAKEFPHAQLKIIGDGAQRTQYERLVERWGLQYRVKFGGRIPWRRLMRLYDEASIVVAPSIWVEPFGRTVAEGMARGRLVVAADAGGPAEIITDNKTGLLFGRNSAGALAARLKDALSLPHLQQRALSEAARRWASEHLAPEKIATEHEVFYRQVMAGSANKLIGDYGR